MLNLGFEESVRKILEWVSPIPYEQHHNTNKRDVLEGTGLWLLREEAMAQWRHSNESSILWLHGIREFAGKFLDSMDANQAVAGSGKTKLV